MELTFFPYDFEYKLEQGKVQIYLYAKLPDGKRVCLIQEYQPYFYASCSGVDVNKLKEHLQKIRINDQSSFAKVESWEEVNKELLGKEENFFKIVVNYPKAVPLISKELESLGVKCYEKDILFIHRYLRDNKIVPMCLTKAEGHFLSEADNQQKFSMPLFKADAIFPSTLEIGKEWSILAVDIETYAENKEIDPEKNPILMLALYGMEKGRPFEKVITWKKFDHQHKYIEYVNDEKALIKRFRELVKELRPDILTGYFSDGFDLPYLNTRAKKYRLQLDLGLDGSNLIINANQNSQEKVCKISGILHLDILKFVKYIFGKDLQVESYSLDAVAEALLESNKHDVNLDNLAKSWDDNEGLAEFCAYNLHDARLTFELCEKLLFDMIEFTKIIGLPTFDVIRMRFSRLVENYILKRAMEFNVLAPNRPLENEINKRMEEHIQGAFVYEPKPGLYENIAVFDFRSLYPSIITSHNLGPESLNCGCCRDAGKVPGLKHWFCRQKKAFTPSVLADLVAKRSELKKEIKKVKAKGSDGRMLEARSYALKILANSFYGYLGFFGARWYCLECAASTTAFARDYIKKTIADAEKTGFQTIYADTDSCFLLLGDKNLDDALNFMKTVNDNLPGNMELEFEGKFKTGIFVALKGSEKGAKKKYALLSEKDELKITGFETVRRNWSILAKEAQAEVLMLVLHGRVEEAIKYARSVVKDLREHKIPSLQLVIKTQITKSLQKYSSLSPHVKVALRMQERGEKIGAGTLVRYIVTKGQGGIGDRARLPDEVREDDYDADYYINNQLIPAVNSIFAVFGYSEEEIFKESSQTGLAKYI